MKINENMEKFMKKESTVIRNILDTDRISDFGIYFGWNTMAGEYEMAIEKSEGGKKYSYDFHDIESMMSDILKSIREKEPITDFIDLFKTYDFLQWTDEIITQEKTDTLGNSGSDDDVPLWMKNGEG